MGCVFSCLLDVQQDTAGGHGWGSGVREAVHPGVVTVWTVFKARRQGGGPPGVHAGREGLACRPWEQVAGEARRVPWTK